MFSLEIVRSDHPALIPKAAMLDFDGTVSIIREGWHKLLTDFFASRLKATPQEEQTSQDKLIETAKTALEPNIGKQPIYQFYTLADLVKERGGNPLEPEKYLAEYYRDLLGIVQRRHDQIRGGLDPRELLIPGTLDLLQMLKRRGLKLYLVSGTEEEFIKEDCKLLRITDYFDGGIYGGQKDPAKYSKAMIVAKILAENNISGMELIGFGDGQTETRDIRAVGGFVIGVASNETARQGIDAWKRNQLIQAGADWIIPDFTDLEQIEKNLFVSS
jgi:phosphoglycolate phosphatase-like HAD superfamily hydrolase